MGAASDGSGIVQIYESMVDTGHESYDPRLDYGEDERGEEGGERV